MLTQHIKRELKLGLSAIYWPLLNLFRLRALRHRHGLRVHLGCGEDKLAGFLNVDCRLTAATDATLDLDQVEIFAPGTVSCFFSNAFFEHLYRNKRLPHLRSIHRALNRRDGFACYIGLPYFPNIAKFYLERAPGTAGPQFDLYNVYRYTHGDPEQSPDWWLEQLHKSLFDEKELDALLREAGFESHTIFCYSFPGDYNEMPVNVGFYATVASRPAERLKEECLSFLTQFKDTKIQLEDIRFLQV